MGTPGKRLYDRSSGMISLDDVRDARGRLSGIIRPTPVVHSSSLSHRAGRPVILKPEHLQRTGSFKVRGAYNFVSRLPDDTVEVVAGSAGNHAQGVALAASLTGHRSTIFMPTNAPLPKIEATRAYGATIRLEDGAVDNALAAAHRYAEEQGGAYIPPFDHPLVIAGQGTIGLELADEAPDAEVVVVAIGGGGLISGIATALAHTRPGVKVVGVEAAGAAAVRASLEAGRLVCLDAVATMADGIAAKSPSELTLAHIRAHVHDVVTVTEEEISRAVLLLLERAKAVVEPAGAVSLAAVLAGKVPGSGPVVTVLSGGNVDPLLLIKLIDHGLTAAGRYLMLRIVLDDRPGALAGVTQALATMGLNVLSVEHHRSGVALPLDRVEVLVTLETRDPEHRDEVLRALRADGYDVTSPNSLHFNT
jgi:threonine dehydratase